MPLNPKLSTAMYMARAGTTINIPGLYIGLWMLLIFFETASKDTEALRADDAIDRGKGSKVSLGWYP